jgi:hypothetical protein
MSEFVRAPGLTNERGESIMKSWVHAVIAAAVLSAPQSGSVSKRVDPQGVFFGQ